MRVKSGTIYAEYDEQDPIHTPGRRKTIMLSFRIFAASAALLVSAPALAQDVKVAIGAAARDGVTHRQHLRLVFQNGRAFGNVFHRA